METNQRIDLHTHSFFSDGALLPSEHLRRAYVKGYEAIAITDHADSSNLEELLDRLLHFARQQEGDFPLTFLPGIELTHVAPRSIAPLARRAKQLGAAIVVVHGETIVEPVVSGTNAAAAACPDVDILAHPGIVTLEVARQAAANGVHLEISSRGGHSLANGHVARIARQASARLIVNTDTHVPGDMIDQEMARLVARAAGLDEAEVEAAVLANPRSLVRRALARQGEE